MATILKDARPAVPRRLDAAWLAAREEAARREADAAEERRRLLEVARGEADELRAAAHAEGLAAGRAAAAACVARAGALRDALLERAEAELAGLALELARRVVGAAAERVSDVAVQSAAQALAAARRRTSVTLRVNPADAAAVRQAQGNLAALVAGCTFALVEDGAVGRGGARVETEAGTIDAGLEVRLEALWQALREEP